MTNKDFEALVVKELDYCKDLLTSKGKEYAEYGDRLQHFKDAGRYLKISPKAALMGQLTKHLMSIRDMSMGNGLYCLDKWAEKITDAINYLLLLFAIINDEFDSMKDETVGCSIG